MNKDEILKKSREENQDGDERYKHIKLQAYSITLYIVFTFCLLYCFVDLFANLNLTAFLPDIMFTLGIFIIWLPNVILAIRYKRVKDILLAILCTSMLVRNPLKRFWGW